MKATEFYNELWQIDKELKEYTTKINTLNKRREKLMKIKRIDLK